MHPHRTLYSPRGWDEKTYNDWLDAKAMEHSAAVLMIGRGFAGLAEPAAPHISKQRLHIGNVDFSDKPSVMKHLTPLERSFTGADVE